MREICAFPVEETFNIKGVATHILSDIGFSECGNYCTISFTGIQRPYIYPLYRPGLEDTHVMFEPNRLDKTDAEKLIATRKRKSIHDAHALDICTAMQITKMPKVLHNSSTILSHDTASNSFNSISVNHMGNTHSIDMIVQNEGDLGTRSLSLARLPKYIDLQHVQTTVNWPSESNDTIQIALNAAAQKTYESDETPAGTNLPAVLRRDQRSIAPVRFATACRIANMKDVTKSVQPEIDMTFPRP